MNIIKCYVKKFIANPASEGTAGFNEIRRQLGQNEGEPEPWVVNPEVEKNIDLQKPTVNKEINDLPRNTIIAIPIGPEENTEDDENFIICRPFFSSHLSLPVKEGELVWVFSETGWEDNENSWSSDGPFYWVSRVHGSIISEDVNYTHFDREYEDINLSIPADAADGPMKEIIDSYKPSYQSQMFTEDDGMRMVNDTAGWYNDEAVPRYTKREGDLVIQGSNNTLISLGNGIDNVYAHFDDKEHAYELDADFGTDGRYTYGDSPVSSYGGAIDIVVGRGTGPEYLPEGTADTLTYPVRGQASTVKNAKGHEEVNKNPTQLQTGEAKVIDHPRAYNPCEGWPDLIYDASRVYLARSTMIDSDLSIPYLHANSFYPEGNEVEGKESGNTDKIDDIVSMYIEHEGPAAAIKSKNVRIVARSMMFEEREVHTDLNTPIKLKGEQGSIILLKEGELDPPFDPESDPKPIAEHASKKGNGRAVIALGADGTIYIDGPRIVIGSGQDTDIEHGKGEQLIFGLEAEEPIVMGNALNTTLQAFMEDVIKFITETFVNHEHATGTGPSGPAGSGTDIPLTSDGVQAHGTDIQAMIDRLNLHLSKIAKTK